MGENSKTEWCGQSDACVIPQTGTASGLPLQPFLGELLGMRDIFLGGSENGQCIECLLGVVSEFRQHHLRAKCSFLLSARPRDFCTLSSTAFDKRRHRQKLRASVYQREPAFPVSALASLSMAAVGRQDSFEFLRACAHFVERHGLVEPRQTRSGSLLLPIRLSSQRFCSARSARPQPYS
jgi:hypothetical protein